MITEQQNGIIAEQPPLLEIKGVHKSFPGVHALKGINFDVRRGEVHALVGENGAGKSTLMHILAGVYQPDEGSIFFNNHQIAIANEHEAQQAGVGMVYQERSLFHLLSVAENIFASGPPINRWGLIDRRRMYEQAREVLAQLRIDVDPDTPLGQLSLAKQQMVEIAKALMLKAKLMIFDEPTAALTEAETGSLFRVIEGLKKQQVGIIYISHRLPEVFQIADRVTVLRDGENRGTLPVSETSPDDLVARMVGRELKRGVDEAVGLSASARVVLEVRHLSNSRLSGDVRTKLKDISFSVRAGEILGFAGLAGAGRTELALAVFGASPRDEGDIFVDEQRVNVHSPQDAIAAGIGYVTEDRKEAGLFLEMSIAQNIAAARLNGFGSWRLDDRKLESVANDYRLKLRIAAPHVKKVVRQLSGGNQQKVVLSRWLLLNPKVLIVDEPTRGIDVGAKAELHQLLRELAHQGKAVIVISSDLLEVLAISDRILVMREGRISGELSQQEASEEKDYALCIACRGGG